MRIEDSPERHKGELNSFCVCVSVCVCAHCGECEKEQVYLTGQVAPLCLKTYLQQSGVYVWKTGKRDGGQQGTETGKEKLSV